MAAKLEILELQTSAQRQKSRPIEYYLSFISHIRIFHANFSPRIISLQINKQASIISPAPSLFLPPLFSLIYLQSRIIRGVGKEHRKIFTLEPAGVKASKFLRCLYSPWGETPQHKENHPDITKELYTERTNKHMRTDLAREDVCPGAERERMYNSDWCRNHKQMQTRIISPLLNKQK